MAKDCQLYAHGRHFNSNNRAVPLKNHIKYRVYLPTGDGPYPSTRLEIA